MESFTAAARDFLYGADFRGNADGAMFWAHGISRQDGGKADGIHLLWWPPRHAGYSFDGFDIWRREQRKPRELSCYELTSGDLTALRTRLRAVTPHALIALRYGKCPAPPPAVPDQPWRRDRPAARPPPSEAESERNRRLAAAMREARRPGPAWRALLRDERAESVRRLLETDPHAHDPVAAVLSRVVTAGGSGRRRPMTPRTSLRRRLRILQDETSLRALLIPVDSVGAPVTLNARRYWMHCRIDRARWQTTEPPDDDNRYRDEATVFLTV